MKKYLLGIFAILLAVGFSSFSATKTVNQPTKFDPTFFYYAVNSSGEIESPDALVNSVARTHAQESSQTLCNGSNAECLRGYINQLSTDPEDYPLLIEPDDSFKHQ
jgi:hypothetical protein